MEIIEFSGSSILGRNRMKVSGKFQARSWFIFIAWIRAIEFEGIILRWQILALRKAIISAIVE